MQNSIVAGSSETDVAEVAVIPARPAGPAVVTIWTDAPTRLIASRKCAGSGTKSDGAAMSAPPKLDPAIFVTKLLLPCRARRNGGKQTPFDSKIRATDKAQQGAKRP
jgi:hypothetical protein